MREPNESYHEWLARQAREREYSDIQKRNTFHWRLFGVFILWVAAAILAMKCGGPEPKTFVDEPMPPLPGVNAPLPPCLDDTTHL